MLDTFINELECKKVEFGDHTILDAVNRFECADDHKYYCNVSRQMFDRFKKYILGFEKTTDVFYIVWDNHDIFLFFSLQANVIFSIDVVHPDDVAKLTTVYKWSITDDEYRNAPELEVFKGQLQYYDGLQEKYSQNDNVLVRTMESVDQIIQGKTIDNQDNIYVGESFPSIEMVNFCKNYSKQVSDKWKVLKIYTPIGATLFWYKILPKIKEVSDIIGCEYVLLFAADKSDPKSDEKRNLLNYYENALYFKNDENLLALKPHYDWECIFLCQTISELCKREIDFKQNFLSGISENDV